MEQDLGRQAELKFYNRRLFRTHLACSGLPLVKFLLDNWFLFLTAIVSGGLLLWPMVSRGGGGGKVGANEAVRLINRERAVLLDVSEPAEYAAGHAVGSRNIPFGQLEKSTELPKNKALPLVVMCPTGARAGRAVSILQKQGHEKVQALAGGLAAWREANLPVDKTA